MNYLKYIEQFLSNEKVTLHAFCEHILSSSLADYGKKA